MPNFTHPHSVEAETSVLGSVLQKPDVFMWLKCDTKVCAESFYIPAHRVIWEAMEALNECGRPIDSVNVIGELKRMSQLEMCGGGLFVDGLEENTPTAAHVESYAKQVEDAHILRKVLQTAITLQHSASQADAEDGRELAAKGITELSEVLAEKKDGPSITEDMDSVIAGWVRQAERRKAGGDVKIQGLSSGMNRMDGILDGLKPGLIVIGALPSTGKTAWEGLMASLALKDDKPVFRITRDSPQIDLVTRDICREAQVHLSVLNKGYLNAIDLERVAKARDMIGKWNVRVSTKLKKLSDIVAAIRADVKRRGTKLVTIDYIQLITIGDRMIDRDDNLKLGIITTTFKGLAYELGIPIICLSQFSRDKDRATGKWGFVNFLSKKPVLQDLRGSGNLEQDADVVILMSKVDDIPDPSTGFTGERKIIGAEVAKHKNGGVGTVFINFHGPTFTMEEVTDNQQAAIYKFLHDEEDLKLKRKKNLAEITGPYFETLSDAVMRADLLSDKE